MKKIAIDVREFENGRMTGIGRFLMNFLVNADKIAPELEFVLFGNQRTSIPFSLPDKFRLIRINEFCTQLWDQVYLPGVMKKENPDVFFSPYYKRPLFTRVPCVVTVHDLIPLIFPAALFERVALKYLMKAYMSGASVLTVSENSRKDINRFFPVLGSAVKTVYNAIDFNGGKKEFSPEERKLLGVSGKYLLYVGNSKPHKNLGILSAGYALLPEKLKSEYSLILAGVGRKYAEVKKGEGVVKIARLEDALLAKLYANASLFVFPSLYEGFGLPPVEAMSFGCPVLSSNASCMPEVLGEAAEYFDPYDAADLAEKIRNVLVNEKRLSELSSSGRAKAAEYSGERFCRGILEFLKEAVRDA